MIASLRIIDTSKLFSSNSIALGAASGLDSGKDVMVVDPDKDSRPTISDSDGGFPL